MSGEPPANSGADVRLAHHILPTSATMLGICTTLIGLVKIVEARIGASHVDELGSLIALMFLVSALTSYASIRSEDRPILSRRCEQVADAVFVLGLLSLSAVSLMFAYEII